MLVRGTLFLAGANVLAVLVPGVLRRAVDDMRAGAPLGTLLHYAWWVIGITAAEGAFRYITRMDLIGTSRRVEFDLRNHLFAHLTTLPLSFYRRQRTGDLMARGTNDVDAVRMMLGPGAMYGLNTVVTVPAVVVLMGRHDLFLTFLALVPFPLMSIGVHRLGRVVHVRSREVQRGFSRLTTLAQENLSGMRVVKASAREAEEISAFRDASQEYLRRNMSLARATAWYHPLFVGAVALSSFAVLWIGGLRVASGTLTLGDLVALLYFVGMLAWPMLALGWVSGLFERGLASLDRIGELLDVKPDIHDPPSPVEKPDGPGELVFEDVNFFYEDAAPPGGREEGRLAAGPGGAGTLAPPRRVAALRNISFRVAPGTTTAIVGRTGSGKSTLLALVARLFDPASGRVLVDGVDTRDMRLADLRRAIGYVPQETFLFSASLRENILLGADPAEISEERFVEAVETSRLGRDADQFPKGFDTVVGERGVTLSGGERQRTALSRALVRSPRIYLLDDPIASVDARTEEEIMAGLSATLRGRTCLFVSHRLSAVRGADQVVVLDEGGIAEIGGYHELLARGGLFAEFHRQQELLLELERQ